MRCGKILLQVLDQTSLLEIHAANENYSRLLELAADLCTVKIARR